MTIDAALDLLDPTHADFESRRTAFNGMIDRNPAYIVRCSSVDDVRGAVRFAREKGLPISVRGGGHGIAGLCIGEGAVVVDLVGLRDVKVDPDTKTAVAGGGATWEEYDNATQAHGLASTGGTFTDTGIAGLTLGGGLGHLMGKLGLSIDNLIGAHVVTADGEGVKASETENADLFWALRGGGGNFGVVTHFEYRLHPVTELYGGMIVFPPDAAPQVLRVVRDAMADAPDELVMMSLIGTDGESRMDANIVSACYQGASAEAERLLAPVRSVAEPMIDLLRPLSYTEMQATFPLMPFGLRHYWKGHFLRQFPDDLIDAAYDHFNTRPQPSLSGLLFEFIGGAPTRVPSDSMAFSQRDARFNVSALGVWEDPALDDGHVRWAREFGAMLEPNATGATYVNYMSADEPSDRIRAAYGDEKFGRLQQIKKQYDPDNVFRFNQNIPPAE
jgi:FAD/FMN-containing dehydrogenase